MILDRRATLAGLGLLGAVPSIARALPPAPVRGNPLSPGKGVCDPQVRIYDDVAYMYSTHDAGPDNSYFTMNDWQVWRSTDLVGWKLAGVLKPEQTYLRRPSTECWATDAIRRNGSYYLYFSAGPDNIGVVVSDHPAGPWRDPLGKPLVAKGDVPTASRDPGILQEADGTSYIVFGTFDYYIARLNEDMISLAEKPRPITVSDKQGPFGIGRTDDKPFLHRRGNRYYLSWGSYYAIGESAYGPFRCVGALIQPDHVDPEFLNDSAMRGPHAPPPQYRPKDWLNFDRHASFFELHGQWYFACNDQSQPGTSPLFRNSVISYVHYRDDGTIAPIRLTRTGVGQYDAHRGIRAADFFRASSARIVEHGPDFAVTSLPDGGHLTFPNVHGLLFKRRLVIDLSAQAPTALEVRRGGLDGPLLGRGSVRHADLKSVMIDLNAHSTDDLCLVVRGLGATSLRIAGLRFT